MIDRGTRVIVVLALLTGTVMAQAGPAQAQEARVRYAPYELQSEAGSRAVYARIMAAAKNACRRGPTFAEFKESKACRADLAGQIVGKIGNRALTALWTGDRGAVQLASRGR